MSRSGSIVLLLAGILLFLASCTPFGYVFYHELMLSPVQSHPLTAGGDAETMEFHAQPGELARLGVEADISTTSVQEDRESLDGDFEARFRFPLRYDIRDADGRLLRQGRTSLAWQDGGSLTKRNAKIDSTGGTLTASTRLEKFRVPGDGRFTLEIALDEDSTYRATVDALRVHLYEGLIDNTGYIAAGLLMLLTGFLAGIIGFILLVVQSARAGTEADPQMVIASDNRDVNQEAMIIQLTGLAGYAVPFGNLVIPVILWLIWRQKDAYLDKMGKEAVNFQLSIVVYFLISFVLCLVLIGFVLLFALMIFHLACIIIGAVQCSRGTDYRYPMTIRFFR